MEDLEFENDLKYIFERREKQSLKSRLKALDEHNLEDDLIQSFNLKEKNALKKRLLSLQDEQKPVITPVFFMRRNWLKFSAAALIIFGIGYLFITSQDSQTENQVAEIKEKIIPAPVPKPTIEPVAKEIQRKITVEEIGQMGFASKQIKVVLSIDKKTNDLRYKFEKETIKIKTNKDVNLKILKFQEKMYIKINSVLYLLDPNPSFTKPEKVKDEAIINMLK